MYIITMTCMAIYGAIALLFVILSTAELFESGRSNTALLWGMVACSFFWPVTLVVRGLMVVFSQLRPLGSRAARPGSFHLSHHSH